MLNNPMQVINMLRNSNNPMGMLQQMISNNPKYRQVMNMVQGKNPKELETYVRNLYQNQNVDINQLASNLGLNIR